MQKLTDKQMEILEMMVNGVSNKEIAKTMQISRVRVQQQKAEVRRRIGAKENESMETSVARYTEWYYNAGPL
jgi:DNA-binding CsgD family transcriptional regulator